MIVVKIEQHSADTGEVTSMGHMEICNDGTGTIGKANYNIRRYSKDGRLLEQGRVRKWPRLSYSVWRLVARCWQVLGIYG